MSSWPWPVYIFDIDGTLADCTHRLPMLKSDAADKYDRFFACVYADAPIKPVIEVLNLLVAAGADIVLCTGRREDCRAATVEWLGHHTDLSREWLRREGKLNMRSIGDRRPDHVVKRQQYLTIPVEQRDNIRGVFDDRSSVVAMWRELGLTCFQVANGDY